MESTVTWKHKGRFAQTGIYLMKFLRMFVFQNDWKVLPMGAFIAALVTFVVGANMFVTQEGTVNGTFALTCVCIWNGFFNSIQVVCRERDVIKREHRSGMHISSYIFSHMLYQALLCAAQTAVTLYVTRIVGVQYPAKGVIVPSFMVDFGISIFLITYASDMLSLWVSTLARTTTTAMTIMPFVLIFQLVFSGGMLALPAWTEPLTQFTISNPGLKVIAAQADTNNRPFVTISDMIGRMRDNEIGGSVTVGQALDLLQDVDNPAIQKLRATTLGKVLTLNEIREALESSASFEAFKQERITSDVTVGDVINLILESENLQAVRDFELGVPGVTLGKVLGELAKAEQMQSLLETKITHMVTVGDVLDAVDKSGVLDEYADKEIDATLTVGEAIDLIASNEIVQGQRDEQITVKTTVGDLLGIMGEDKVKTFLEEKAAAASYKADYERDRSNVAEYWTHLILFVLIFAALSTITLEFIDKDKR